MMENQCKWRIADFEKLNDQAVYIPLDFYPLCKYESLCVLSDTHSTCSHSTGQGHRRWH